MARTNFNKVLNKRSSVADKVPEDLTSIDYGELVVNYATGKEFIGIKSSDNEFVKFKAHNDASDISFNGEHSDSDFTGTTVESSIKQLENTIIDNEEITASSLNDLNTKVTANEESITGLTESVSTKQATLVSGTNIKTINGNSLLGSGDLSIVTPIDDALSDTSTNPVQNKVVNTALGTKFDSANIKTDLASPSDTTVPSTNLLKKQVDSINDTISGLNASDIAFTKASHVDTSFSGETVETVLQEMETAMLDNELAISSGLNDLNDRIIAADDLYYKIRAVEKVLPDYIGYGTSGSTTAQSITLDANKFFVVGRTTSLTISLPSGSDFDCLEYCCQFYVPSDSFTLTVPSTVAWQDGTAPTFEANSCCQMVIVNNCATIGTYKQNS